MRLRGFNYAHPGAYFITVSTRNRICLLGDVIDDKMPLSEAGRLAQAVWEGLPTHYPHIRLDAWVVMPNHVHGIVMLTEADPDPHPIRAGFKPAPAKTGTAANNARHGLPEIYNDPVRAGFKPAPAKTGTAANNARHGLPEIVRAFKTFSARRINDVRGAVGTPVWQRNYYEHIIRDDEALNRIRQYIMDNPARWHEDPENPHTMGGS